MILSNFATLLGVSPRELTDWFWVAYIDAYDWVVEPNVLGLDTFATGALFTTKPYVSGANYIRRMSDYRDRCPLCPGQELSLYAHVLGLFKPMNSFSKAILACAPYIGESKVAQMPAAK
jgi:hypothetical protein